MTFVRLQKRSLTDSGVVLVCTLIDSLSSFLLLGVAKLLGSPHPGRLLDLGRLFEVVEDLIGVDLIVLGLPVLAADHLDRVLADLAEAVVLLQMLGLVLSELEEGSVVLLGRVIGVTHQIKQVAILLHDVVELLLGVLVGVSVELASGGLQLVGHGGLLVGADLLNTSLSIGACEVFNTEEELHDALEFFLLVADEILIAAEVDRVLAFGGAMTDHGVEVSLVQISVELDPPVPPLREFSVVFVLWLLRVTQGVGKRSEGLEHVDRVTEAADHLLRVERNRAGHEAGMMSLHNPAAVIGNLLTSHTHDLQRC